MRRLGINGLLLLAGMLLGSASMPALRGEGPGASQEGLVTASAQPAAPAPMPEPPLERRVSEVLGSGVVIIISLSSQRMHVFRDGVLWRSSPVSTGKRTKQTPQGVFAILQKKRFHRSNLYSNAPMPFMQRLTWGGIAIHAGRLPGYPASHGCIRVPRDFAEALYGITAPAKTAVIIVDEPLPDDAGALALARKSDALVPISPELLRRERIALAKAQQAPVARPPAARTIPAPAPAAKPSPSGSDSAATKQTIQLAAALSADDAKARWEALAGRRPELRAMQVSVIPAVVNGTQYYRLRASAPDAHATCKALKSAGIECFPVS